ncbi:MAG: toxin-antitoxin system YwqK family antitoxin [Marinifilaceae bacterium]
MKLKLLQLFLILVIPVVSNAQSFEVFNGDTINVVDGNNLKQGRWVELNNAVKIQEGNYIDNKKQGIWRKYYLNGNIAHKVTYRDNRPEGAMCFYYESGEILEEGIWKNEHWVGEFKFYNKNGNLSYKWHYNDAGRRTGEQKYYYESGKIKIDGFWKDGVKEGEVKEFYPDGSVKCIKHYSQGNLDKQGVKLFAQGERNENMMSENSSKVEVFDGNGYHKFYNKENKLDREGEFRKGKLIDGKRYYYAQSGGLSKTAIYQNAKVIRVIEHNQ